MYTSGTTARPKGCLMTHEMVVRNGIAVGRAASSSTPEDRFWDPLPMFHMSAILPMTGCFFTGCAFMSMTHFEAGTALADGARARDRLLPHVPDDRWRCSTTPSTPPATSRASA